MNDAIQQPLTSDLYFTPQGEAIHTLVAANVGKHRLHGTESLAIDKTAIGAIDLALHFVRIGLATGLGPPEEKGHLATCGAIRVF